MLTISLNSCDKFVLITIYTLFSIKPRPNNRNMSTQHIATLLGATCCAQQCCDMLRWLDAIVWRGLRFNDSRMVPTKCKSFCSKLGPRGKSTSLQVLLEFTKKNYGINPFHAHWNAAKLEDKTMRSSSFEFGFVLQFRCIPVYVKRVYSHAFFRDN